MSYILDALRKADAQRERSPARGIHAQPFNPPVQDKTGERNNRLVWLVAGAILGAALIALIGWWLSSPDTTLQSSAAPVASRPSAEAPSPMASAPLRSQASAPLTSPAPANEVLPAAPPPRPTPAAAPPGEFGNVQKPAAAAAAAEAGERLLSAAELPPDVLRDLPKLTITGGVYSANPALRMLIVNGLVLNEGAEIAPGVVLAQIRPKVAVLTFRGWRYGVTY
jgi:general secretion pathway protein B